MKTYGQRSPPNQLVEGSQANALNLYILLSIMERETDRKTFHALLIHRYGIPGSRYKALQLRKWSDIPVGSCHLKKVKGYQMEEGKKRKLQCWVNWAGQLGRGLGFGIMIGSIRQVTPWEAPSLTSGTVERDRGREVWNLGPSLCFMLGRGHAANRDKPRGKKEE